MLSFSMQWFLMTCPTFLDVDNRVRAIAKEVFGLTTVIWNQDSEGKDFCLSPRLRVKKTKKNLLTTSYPPTLTDWMIGGGTTLNAVEASLKKFYSGSKSPGLIILEHELSDSSVNAFMYSWPLIASNGWKHTTIAEAANQTTDPGNAWYQNAQDDASPPVSATIGAGPQTYGE